MKTAVSNSILCNHIVRIALAVVAILLIPLIAMQFDNGVNWELNDFVIAGALLFVTGLVLDTILGKVRGKNRKLIAVVALILIFMYIWAELAVGIFTHLGS
ncbi:MAG TPA: hypothetical protein VFW90_00260 [Candidatus Saccharimonadales bacterium]|nr:hypothetical protein [Candidatus Saccharimonadales bacterium]